MKTLVYLLAFAMAAIPNLTRGETWQIQSPNHAQTYSYGSERHRQWAVIGKHLAVYMQFTNDPYVDRNEPRQYDDFVFEFPNVRLGADGRTFYYHSPRGHTVAVARQNPGFLFDVVSLLPSSSLEVRKIHGLLSLTLLVSDDHSLAANGASGVTITAR